MRKQHSSTWVSTCGVRVPGTRASLRSACALQRLRSLWDLFGPGTGRVPCTAGGVLSTEPPTKASQWFFKTRKKYLNPFLLSGVTSLMRPAPAVREVTTPFSLGAPASFPSLLFPLAQISVWYLPYTFIYFLTVYLLTLEYKLQGQGYLSVHFLLYLLSRTMYTCVCSAVSTLPSWTVAHRGSSDMQDLPG